MRLALRALLLLALPALCAAEEPKRDDYLKTVEGWILSLPPRPALDREELSTLFAGTMNYRVQIDD